MRLQPHGCSHWYNFYVRVYAPTAAPVEPLLLFLLPPLLLSMLFLLLPRPPPRLSTSLRHLSCVYMFICRVICVAPDVASRFALPAPVAHMCFAAFVSSVLRVFRPLLGCHWNLWMDSVAYF